MNAPLCCEVDTNKKRQTILFSDEIDYAQTKADDNKYEWQEE